MKGALNLFSPPVIVCGHLMWGPHITYSMIKSHERANLFQICSNIMSQFVEEKPYIESSLVIKQNAGIEQPYVETRTQTGEEQPYVETRTQTGEEQPYVETDAKLGMN